ncbi:MAG TPA: glycosyltransferase family 2 protein [Blastocatellia bacterium]|nr:glycosyltransferase family 2 protein [Blastocatellia bacterium]
MYRGHCIAVVMPIHNEGEHLARAISRVPDLVDMIVAIDDGSSDKSWLQLCEIEDRRLVRLRHAKNLGVGAATRAGYKRALEAQADYIAVMDGDGQMDGRDLPSLLDRAIAGADYVKGNRLLHTETISRMPLTRLIGNLILSWLMKRASSFDGSLDAQCGYTVIRAASLDKISLDELYKRYGFLNEMFFAARRAGLKIATVPVRSVYGSELSGINPFTAVPTIIYLIARGFIRMRFSNGSIKPALSIQQTGGESAK